MLDSLQDTLLTALRLRLDGSPLALLALAFALGAVHTVLPGHGKALMAGVHSRAREGWSDVATRTYFIALMRATVSLIVVTGSAYLASKLGLRPFEIGAMMAGLVLVGLGAWLVSRSVAPARSARLHSVPSFGLAASDPNERERTAPLYLLGLVPDPLAIVVLSAAVAVGAQTGGLIAVAGLALGMGTMLLVAAKGGGRLIERASGAVTAVPLGGAVRVGAGLVTIAMGALFLLLDAPYI